MARHSEKKGIRCDHCGLSNHRTYECTRAHKRQCGNCGMTNHLTIDCRRPRSAQYQDVFATEKDPLTMTPYYMHTIRQMDDEVVYKRPYPIPVSNHEKVREELKKMQGIIIPPHLAYNTPLIPVVKKDGGIRICLDFRALNLKLRADKYTLPSIQHIKSVGKK